MTGGTFALSRHAALTSPAGRVHPDASSVLPKIRQAPTAQDPAGAFARPGGDQRMIRLHLNWLRLACIRHGHALHCTSLGHVCARCGRSYERLP